MAEIDAMFKLIAADHILLQEGHRQFEQEHQLLLRVQVVMQDTMRELAASQKNTDERLKALISIADGWIRSNPK